MLHVLAEKQIFATRNNLSLPTFVTTSWHWSFPRCIESRHIARERRIDPRSGLCLAAGLWSPYHLRSTSGLQWPTLYPFSRCSSTTSLQGSKVTVTLQPPFSPRNYPETPLKQEVGEAIYSTVAADAVFSILARFQLEGGGTNIYSATSFTRRQNTKSGERDKLLTTLDEVLGTLREGQPLLAWFRNENCVKLNRCVETETRVH